MCKNATKLCNKTTTEVCFPYKMCVICLTNHLEINDDAFLQTHGQGGVEWQMAILPMSDHPNFVAGKVKLIPYVAQMVLF